jgi:glycosyltransferase involved in cell wall biosynthesis
VKRLGILALVEPDNGGVYQYALSLIEALRTLPGWQTTVYRARGSASFADPPLRELASSKSRSLALSLLGEVSAQIADPFADEDIVISAMYSPYLLHTRVPFVYTLHDMQERYLPDNFSLWQKRWRAFVHPRIAARATRILCESQFVRNDIVQFLGVPQGRIEVIPAPPRWQGDAEPDEAAREAVRAKYGLPERFLFYPAQYWPHKNHLRLIEAFARVAAAVPAVDLVLTGHPRFEFAAIKQEIERRGLEKRVHQLGFVDGGDVPALYKLSAALVMPSLFESISIPVYEAFRMGTPVCASGVLAIGEQVGDAGLTFDPRSVDAMAVAMREILANVPLRERCVRAGREKLAQLTTERYALQLDGLLGAALRASAVRNAPAAPPLVDATRQVK